MRNGQLKPGYNVQTGTENQFVTGFSIHRRPGDTSCMKDHLESMKRQMGKLPKTITADAGYGSEENYEYLKAEQVESYVKYNTYDKEKSRKMAEGCIARAELAVPSGMRPVCLWIWQILEFSV